MSENSKEIFDVVISRRRALALSLYVLGHLEGDFFGRTGDIHEESKLFLNWLVLSCLWTINLN